MGDVLPYKWEAYCRTNGKRTAGFPFLRSLEARKVRRYKWGAYCRTNWRCTAVLFREVVGVGVSETLPSLLLFPLRKAFCHTSKNTCLTAEAPKVFSELKHTPLVHTLFPPKAFVFSFFFFFSQIIGRDDYEARNDYTPAGKHYILTLFRSRNPHPDHNPNIWALDCAILLQHWADVAPYYHPNGNGCYPPLFL